MPRVFREGNRVIGFSHLGYTSPIIFNWPPISPPYTGVGFNCSASIRHRIFRPKLRDPATFAIWNVRAALPRRLLAGQATLKSEAGVVAIVAAIADERQ